MKWQSVRKLLERPSPFLEKLRRFSPQRATAGISRIMYQRLRRELETAKAFEEPILLEACPAAITLARWCRGVGHMLWRLKFGGPPVRPNSPEVLKAALES